jgi:DNA repair photolyase
MAFWRDEARAAYDPHAPSISERKEGVVALREAGIPVVLRIDPLFPRSPLPIQRSSLRDFGLEEAQTLDDLENLVAFAREVGLRHVVYSAAKIVQPRGRQLSPTMAAMRRLYEAICAPSKPVWRGFSWRLPQHVAEQQVVRPFVEICKHRGVAARFCMRDLVQIP